MTKTGGGNQVNRDAVKALFDDIPPFIGMTGRCVQEMIDGIPNSTLETEWVPVTSYLPKTDGRFMVTVKGRRGKPHVEMRNFHGGSRTWELQCSGECVIAWQPRPRPYGLKPKGDMQNVSV